MWRWIFRLLVSCMRKASYCREMTWKWPGRRQTRSRGFPLAMTKRRASHSHVLSALFFLTAFAHTVLVRLCMGFGPISPVSSLFHAIFLLHSAFDLSIFHFSTHPPPSHSILALPSLLAFPFSLTLFLYSPLASPLFLHYSHLYVFLDNMQGPAGRV